MYFLSLLASINNQFFYFIFIKKDKGAYKWNYMIFIYINLDEINC